MISLSLGLTENIRGPGLWKLNTSFLSDEEYLKCIKKVILKTCDDYKDDKDVDDALLWEMIKLKVRESSIFYGKEKAKSRRTDETKQYDTITYLEKKIDGTMSPILKGELEQKLIEAKENLEKMYEYKTQGTICYSAIN